MPAETVIPRRSRRRHRRGTTVSAGVAAWVAAGVVLVSGCSGRPPSGAAPVAASPTPASSPLIGRWRVVSVVAPDTSVFPLPAGRAGVVFGADRSLVLDDGVNQVRVRYRPLPDGFRAVGPPTSTAVGFDGRDPVLATTATAMRAVAGLGPSGPTAPPVVQAQVAGDAVGVIAGGYVLSLRRA